MNIFLDNVELDITLENEKTVGDILRALEAELEQNSATVLEICADKTAVPANELDALFLKPIESVQQLDVKTISAQEITNVISELCGRFEDLADKLEDVPVQLQKNEDTAAMGTVTELADSLSLLFQTIPYVGLFPDHFANLTIASEPLSPFVQQFPELLQSFLDAVEANDTVSIGDLAEYEIAPKLKQLATLKESL